MEQYVLREPLGAVLASLATDIRPLGSEEYEATQQRPARLQVERLTYGCANMIASEAPATSIPVLPSPRAGPFKEQDFNLWALLDDHVGAQNQMTNSTAVEVQR